MKGGVGIAAKFLVTGILFWIIAEKVDVAAASNAMLAADVDWIAVAALLTVGLIAIEAFRWRSVLASSGVRIGLWPAALHFLGGAFFAQVLPSVLGIDGFRLAQLARAGVPIATAVRSVLVDRVWAFAGIVIVIAAMFPRLLSYLSPEGQVRILLVVAAAVALGGATILGTRLLPSRLLELAARSAYRVGEALRISNAVRPVLLASLAAQLTRGLTCWAAAMAVGVQIEWLDLFALVPLALLIAMVPISVGMWGIREAAFIVMLGLANVSAPDALAVSIMIGLLRVAGGLFGGLVWLLAPRSQYAIGDVPVTARGALEDARSRP